MIQIARQWFVLISVMIFVDTLRTFLVVRLGWAKAWLNELFFWKKDVEVDVEVEAEVGMDMVVQEDAGQDECKLTSRDLREVERIVQQSQAELFRRLDAVQSQTHYNSSNGFGNANEVEDDFEQEVLGLFQEEQPVAMNLNLKRNPREDEFGEDEDEDEDDDRKRRRLSEEESSSSSSSSSKKRKRSGSASTGKCKRKKSVELTEENLANLTNTELIKILKKMERNTKGKPNKSELILRILAR